MGTAVQAEMQSVDSSGAPDVNVQPVDETSQNSGVTCAEQGVMADDPVVDELIAGANATLEALLDEEDCKDQTEEQKQSTGNAKATEQQDDQEGNTTRTTPDPAIAAFLSLAGAMMEASGPKPTFAEFSKGKVPENNPW